MKKTLLTLSTLILSTAAFAQKNELTETDKRLADAEKVDTTKTWTWSGLYNASVSQTSLTNWAAGGSNNTNVSFLLRQLAVMKKNRWTWSNLLEANLGYNFQDNGTLKTADKLEFTSRLDRGFDNRNWRLSLFANYRTQFTDGFTNFDDTVRISTFMAPGFLTYGVGVTNTSIKGLNVYFSPVQVRNTFVLDSTLFAESKFFDNQSPNVMVLAGNRGLRWELGAFLDIVYQTSITESLTMNSRINFYSNYLDRPQNVDINWETIFLLKAYKNITVSWHFHLIYDHDINVRYRGNEPTADLIFNAPGTQFMSVVGVGIGYAFGAFKK